MSDPCPRCGGSGYIMVDDFHVRQCVCSYARDMKEHLGPEIAGATVIYESPLYVPGEVDLTEEPLFIKGNWRDVKAHLKWVLFYKGLSYKFRIVTDERLKAVYLGAEDYRAKAKIKRESDENYNTLSDLVGEDFDLVIIIVGQIGYKNVAAPGILKEALMLRETLGKVTWLVEDPLRVWRHSYDIDVGEYVRETFRTVVLAGARPRFDEDPAPQEEVGLDDEPEQYTGPSPIEAPNLPEAKSVVCSAPSKPWKGSKSYKKGSSGGGPAGVGEL